MIPWVFAVLKRFGIYFESHFSVFGKSLDHLEGISAFRSLFWEVTFSFNVANLQTSSSYRCSMLTGLTPRSWIGVDVGGVSPTTTLCIFEGSRQSKVNNRSDSPGVKIRYRPLMAKSWPVRKRCATPSDAPSWIATFVATGGSSFGPPSVRATLWSRTAEMKMPMSSNSERSSKSPLSTLLVVTLVLEIDLDNRIAWVELGVINIDLTRKLSAHSYHIALINRARRSARSAGMRQLWGATLSCLRRHERPGRVAMPGALDTEPIGYDLRGALEGTLGVVTKVAVTITPTLLMYAHSFCRSRQR